MTSKQGNARSTPEPMLDMRRHAGDASALLKAMGNEQRLLILCQLVGRECGVGELLASAELSQSALSQHLAKLRDAGLVQSRRDGLSIFYSLPDGPVQRVMATLHGIYCGPRR